MRQLLLKESIVYGKAYPVYAYIPYSKGVKRFRLHAYFSKVGKNVRIHFDTRSYPVNLVIIKDLKKPHVTTETSKNNPVYTLERLR